MNVAPQSAAVSFYVEKTLATGRFRFAARRRRELTSIDDDPSLSTGSAGEFVRHRDEIFYSADHRPIRQPVLPESRSIATTPFSATLIDNTPRGRGFLALIILGALLCLMGISVLVRKGGAGWVEIILGLVLIVAPVLLTARRRSVVRAEERRREKERAEQDAREREMLAAYAAALDRLRETPTEENLRALRIEREKLDLPYAIWGDAARSTIQQIGFNELAARGPQGASAIAELMDRSSEAAGLVQEDVDGVRQSIASTVLWHLIADDRLGTAQQQTAHSIRRDLRVESSDVPADIAAEEQFDRLRGIDHRSVPKCDAPFAMAPREFCIYKTQGELAGAGDASEVVVTNKRVAVGSGKRDELETGRIDSIDVDADTNVVTIVASGRKRPLTMTIAEPIYFASMVSLATTLDERPKSFM